MGDPIKGIKQSRDATGLSGGSHACCYWQQSNFLSEATRFIRWSLTLLSLHRFERELSIGQAGGIKLLLLRVLCSC
jgi:hypothetical protein